MHIALLLLVLTITSAVPGFVEAQGQTPAGGGRGRGAAGASTDPGPVSESVRTMSAWGRLRTAAPSLLGWSVSVPADAFPSLRFHEAAAKADALGVASIEGSSRQQVSIEIQKLLSSNLAPGERVAVRDRLRALNLRMPVYAISSIGPGESDSRNWFELAKAWNVETIAPEQIPGDLSLIERLAQEFGINVALSGDPRKVAPMLQGRGSRLGAYADLAAWIQQGIEPLKGIELLKDRLLVVKLGDASSLGASGRPVPLGTGVLGLSRFLSEIHRMQLSPSLIVASGPGRDVEQALVRALEAFEKALQPVAALRVAELALKTPDKGPSKLTAEQREQVSAAIPRQPAAKPKKPRRLLVLDANIGYGGPRGGHLSAVAAANMTLTEFGKATGAFEPVFSNDLNNLKYENIRQFDAIFLNNTVGMLFADPLVRAGLVRFVREGGGLAGYHGTSHASMDWPEFAEMLGAVQGTHREPTEEAVIKVDDPKSPLTAAFRGKEFVHPGRP